MKRYIPLAMLLLIAGCQIQDGAAIEQTVTIEQLGRETEHLIFFNYVGSDVEFDHYTTAEDKKYRVARSEEDKPAAFPANGTMRLFVTVKDGKIAIPDAKKMSNLSPEELEHPYKRR